jgi:hypothetical protein
MSRSHAYGILASYPDSLPIPVGNPLPI